VIALREFRERADERQVDANCCAYATQAVNAKRAFSEKYLRPTFKFEAEVFVDIELVGLARFVT
jgi:hypothetical protein